MRLGRARAVDPGEVRASACCSSALAFLVLVPAGATGAERTASGSARGGWSSSYLHLRARRAVPQPGRPERDDQARAAAHRRADDGRLVPVERGRQHSPAGRRASSSTMPLPQLFGAVAAVAARHRGDRCSRWSKPIKRLMGGRAARPWRSKNTNAKRDFTKTPEPAGKVADAKGARAVLLRPEAPRQPPALRLPPRAQRRAAVVGRAEGAVARSEDEAAGDARRGSSVRLRRVRRRHPRRLRRRHRDALGPRHVDAGESTTSTRR